MTERLPLLLIEDDPVDVVLVERALRKCSRQFEMNQCNSLESAVEMLQQNKYVAILVDLSLSDSFGLKGVSRLAETAPETPIVVLTGLADDRMALDALEAGAQDYLVKGQTNSELLDRTLRYAIQRQQILSENRRLMAKLEQLARFDPLTGVLNRHSFSELMIVEWTRAERHGHPLSCVMLDIDFFKRINDTYGHSVGDSALRAVADVLKEHGRNSDFVARYGGEEFCVILTDTLEDEATAWAERLRERLAAIQVQAETDTFRLTASFGVAARREGVDDPERLIDHADQALFLAKQLGRNQVVTYGSMRRLLDDRLDNVAKRLDGVVASELMSPIALMVPDELPLSEVISQVLLSRLEVVAVLDEHGHLVGQIGEDDLLTHILATQRSSVAARDVMQKMSVSFPASTPIETICDFFGRVASRRVFIVEDQKPVGVITCNSLLRWINNSQRPASRASNELGEAAQEALLTELETHWNELKQLLTDHDAAPAARIGTTTRLQELLDKTLSDADELLDASL